MAPSLGAAGMDGDGPPHNISGGDGSEVAFQRIRSGEYQVGDRRRAAAPAGLADRRRGEPRLRRREGRGYVAPAHLVVPDNIEFDGGPKNIYDPDNGYPDAYQKIWGVDG